MNWYKYSQQYLSEDTDPDDLETFRRESIQFAKNTASNLAVEIERLSGIAPIELHLVGSVLLTGEYGFHEESDLDLGVKFDMDFDSFDEEERFIDGMSEKLSGSLMAYSGAYDVLVFAKTPLPNPHLKIWPDISVG